MILPVRALSLFLFSFSLFNLLGCALHNSSQLNGWLRIYRLLHTDMCTLADITLHKPMPTEGGHLMLRVCVFNRLTSTIQRLRGECA